MSRKILLALVLHVCASTTASAWWDQNWTRRIKLTFLNSGQPENLANFPVLVRLDGSRVNYGDTQNAGQDVRFVDANDTTLLAHEIELWNESGSSFAWVKVPQVDASSNADFIWLYYGNSVAPDAQNPTQVWDASFEMVQHLHETSGTHFDSTSKNNDSVSVSVTTQGSPTGRIDGADVFAGTDNIDVADAASLDMGASDSFTLEAWVKTSFVAGWQVVVSKEDVPAGGQYQLWTDTGNPKFWLVDAGSVVSLQANGGSSVANDAFHYLVGRWDEPSGTAQLFVDGASVASATNGGLGSLANARPLRIGEEGDADPEGGGNFTGTIDEVRLSRIARSNNWIKAQHLSMSDGFVSYGAPTPSGVMRVKSGTYSGTGADNRAIYVGFQPDVVFIDMDEAVDVAPNEAVIRTATMVGDASKAIDNAVALSADEIQSLDSTGFTVGTHASVNSAGLTYHWVAFQAAAGKLNVGSYPGNSTDNTNVTGIGFQPEYVIVMSADTQRAVHRSSAMPGDYTLEFASLNFADGIQALQADGFQVGLDARVNAAGVTYYYAAWNASPGEVAVGVYTGNGALSRDITGLGFFPEEVMVNRGASTSRSTHKPASTGVTINRSLLFESRLGAIDHIQALLADGFRVGADARVNSASAPNDYYWIAFGPHMPQTNYRSIGTATDVSGTLTATQGSVQVSDASATWQTANRGRGDRINIGGTDYTVGAVTSQTQLQLTQPFAAASGSYAYTIARQFATLQAWEDCVSFAVACSFFPVGSASLVADDRKEIGIAYKDSAFTANVTFNGSTTDAQHDITLTADAGNRHYGIPGQGVVVDGAALLADLVRVQNNFVTVEWLELKNGLDPAVDGVHVNVNLNDRVVLRNLLIHDVPQYGIVTSTADLFLDAYNNVVYNAQHGIRINVAMNPGTQARLFNNTVFSVTSRGMSAVGPGPYPDVTLRNNIAHRNGLGVADFDFPGGLNPASSNNLSSDLTAPGPGSLTGVSIAAVSFVNSGAGDLHINAGSAAENVAADLSGVFSFDIDGGARLTPWDIGADDIIATTEVELVSFEANGLDGAVELRWETASELSNLGFHLYRADLEEGPYVRITSRPVPGLGSSPAGAKYSYQDSGLTNGVTYFYELEDIETTGKTTLHGPVSATPSAEASSPAVESRSLITYGNPQANGFRVLEQSHLGVVVELVTEGFYAVPQEDGSVLLEIPGFEPLSGSPSVPVLRPWIDALAGRGAVLGSVRESSVESFQGLKPSGAETPEIVASRKGTVSARRGRAQAHVASEGLVPRRAARLVRVGFQGDTKRAQLELAPLRWNGASSELVLTKRLTVAIDFRGRSAEARRPASRARTVAFRLATTQPGLHQVGFEELFSGRRGVAADSLRLSRLGEPVAFHIEPAGKRFGPRSKLYFLSEGPAANPYGKEAVYELEVSKGLSMEVASAAPSGEPVLSYIQTDAHEENRFYQAGLVEAPDLWLWEILMARETKSFSFAVSGLAAGPARLRVMLQGVSDFPEEPDHHLRLSVNGTLLEEVSWDGKQSRAVELPVPEAVLREGENSLEIENVGDTGVPYSMVMLDRFELSYPRVLSGDGVEGVFLLSGTAAAPLGASYLLDLTDKTPRWLSGAELSPDGTFRFRVEEGRRYLALSRDAVRRPLVRNVAGVRLRKETLQADYIVIGPREFSSVAAPLLEHRSRQGLHVRFAALEDVYSEFGFGETRPEAIKEFLSFAYHQWKTPRLRYVLLLGDATYDFKDYLKTGVTNQVPPFLVKTSYLWTASDPALAAVHGDDLLPDLAIGRLPAKDADELRAMVEKILAYEAGEANLDGLVVLVTDNPDRAGDFAANADELSRGVLAGREVLRLDVGVLGGATRSEILRSFDEGASLLSYIGHGGIHLWADENIFNTLDVASMSPQVQQPLLLTMNCLNGYFHFPYFDSLAESLLKAEHKGAIAAFSPSGLSLNEPAHLFHKALLDELQPNRHPRLGDAVLAAQEAFASTGAFPELLEIFHLLGDPALPLR